MFVFLPKKTFLELDLRKVMKKKLLPYLFERERKKNPLYI